MKHNNKRTATNEFNFIALISAMGTVMSPLLTPSPYNLLLMYRTHQMIIRETPLYKKKMWTVSGNNFTIWQKWTSTSPFKLLWTPNWHPVVTYGGRNPDPGMRQTHRLIEFRPSDSGTKSSLTTIQINKQQGIDHAHSVDNTWWR